MKKGLVACATISPVEMKLPSDIEKAPQVDIPATQIIPETVSETSPYYSEVPLTSGDLKQRIQNSLPKQSKYFKFFNAHLKKPVLVGVSLVFGSVFSVFMANALITWQKEKELVLLLAERNRLREVLKARDQGESS